MPKHTEARPQQRPWFEPANVRLGNFELADDVRDIAGWERLLPPKNWVAGRGEALEARLPVKWPKKYYGPGGQKFAPASFYQSACMLCNWYLQDPSHKNWVSETVEMLIERAREFTQVQGSVRFPIYTFDHSYRNKQIKAPWTSAYACGAYLLGLTRIVDTFRSTHAQQLADEIFAGMMQLRASPDQTEYWVSMVDENGYLWLEEMPLAADPQPRILNGHIRGITGIYTYWLVSPTRTAEWALQATLQTMKDHVHLYRRPGQVNAYDLLPKTKIDYGPLRTVNQQKELFAISQDGIFQEMAEKFASDLRESQNR